MKKKEMQKMYFSETGFEPCDFNIVLANREFSIKP